MFKHGYNSHGHWSTIGEIRDLEVNERGNQFPENIKYPDSTPAIWIAFDPMVAVRYNMSVEDWDDIRKGKIKIDPEECNIKKIVIKSGDKIIHNDGDGGYLLIRTKEIS